jgi:hypothetical protein
LNSAGRRPVSTAERGRDEAPATDDKRSGDVPMSVNRYRRVKRMQEPGGLRRWKVSALVGGVTLAVLGAGLGVALADTNDAATIVCPTVADKLPAVPAQAKAEVDRNLQLLNTQINEANNRLATSAGQGGPNFVQNAILGPLADKRKSTIDRIAIAIGRVDAKPTGLDALATCALSTGATPPAGETAGETAAPPAQEETTAPPADEETTPPADGAAAGKIVCPTVADRLPAVPAQATAAVERNLALLQTQINEANNRLVTSAGEGGPNFVQNAILGPLKDKRVATINRIATAIGRNAARPQGLDALAPCQLT